MSISIKSPEISTTKSSFNQKKHYYIGDSNLEQIYWKSISSLGWLKTTQTPHLFFDQNMVAACCMFSLTSRVGLGKLAKLVVAGLQESGHRLEGTTAKRTPEQVSHWPVQPWLHLLPETNSKFAPENRPKPKRTWIWSSNHQFSIANRWFQGGYLFLIWGMTNYPVTIGSTTAANMRIAMNQSRHPKTFGSSGTSKNGGGGKFHVAAERKGGTILWRPQEWKRAPIFFWGGVLGIPSEMRLRFWSGFEFGDILWRV